MKNLEKNVGFTEKRYCYLIDDSSDDKKEQLKKKICQRKIETKNYKICLEAT